MEGCNKAQSKAYGKREIHNGGKFLQKNADHEIKLKSLSTQILWITGTIISAKTAMETTTHTQKHHNNNKPPPKQNTPHKPPNTKKPSSVPLLS